LTCHEEGERAGKGGREGGREERRAVDLSLSSDVYPSTRELWGKMEPYRMETPTAPHALPNNTTAAKRRQPLSDPIASTTPPPRGQAKMEVSDGRPPTTPYIWRDMPMSAMSFRWWEEGREEGRDGEKNGGR